MNQKNIIFPLTIIFSMAIMFGTSDAENPAPGGNPNSPSGGEQSACSMDGGSPLEISYESLDPGVHTFFKNQLTKDLFEKVWKCCVYVHLRPCSYSHIKNGHLTCVNGEKECVLDRMFACATKFNEWDWKSVGKFVIDMFNNGNQMDSAKKFASSNGLSNWDAIEKCYKSGDGDKYCQEYSQYTSKAEAWVSPDSLMIVDFKKWFCQGMKDRQLSCPIVCTEGANGSENTGGSHGGGSGHTNGGVSGH